MMVLLALVNILLLPLVSSDTTVTIYNEWLSQGGRVHYEVDRWNKHNGLTNNNLIPKCKAIGTETGRWLNRDLDLFKNWPQSPSHHGYPDPRYLQDQTLQRNTWNKYMEDIHGYGHDINMVWETKGILWPNWIDKSQHKGHFPNNLDSAGEFVSLMVQGLKDYSAGHIPPFFEVINEPFATFSGSLDTKTIIDFHRIVAQKLKSRFGIKVGGPTFTGYSALNSDVNNFSLWKRTSEFMDMSLDHLDFFSFHAYNHLYVSGGSHHFTGINEARLVAFVDMVENYSHLKKGKNVPLIISEYGRGGVHGISQNAHSGIVDFATVYQSTAHLFTYLNLREFIERAVVFLQSNEQYQGHDSLNWSLFSKDGHETKNTNHYKFWHHLGYDHRFLKFSSQYSGSERVVAPLALANSKTKEVVILLVNYATTWQNVHLDFHGGWINPTAGQSTCLVYQNGQQELHSNVHFDTTKNHGNVGIPGEAACMYTFQTSFNFGGLHTNNENTYYGNNMVIPITNGHAQTTIHLPSSGYHTSHLRIGVSRDNKNQIAKPTSVMFNGYKLPSSYMLYDTDKNEAKTRWELWEFLVPEGRVQSTNTISMTFGGSGGHVSSVALVVGKLQ